MINIAGLDKAAVLAALHNGTQAVGMGRLHDIGRDMTVGEARQILGWGDDVTRMVGTLPGLPAPSEERLYFDYVQGRPLKVDIAHNEFDESLYDRDAGNGAAAQAIANLRASLASSN